MFSKSFRVKSNSQLKGSERKRIRTEIQKNFPLLTEEDLHVLVPNKEVIVVMRLITHSGDAVIVYCLQKVPIVFEVEEVLLPSVYLLWQFPDAVPSLTTWPQVSPKICGGADLMLPGVVGSYGHLRKGDVVAVNVTNNRAAVAVGHTTLSSEDMFMAGRRGRAVHILHCVGDELWAYGTKVQVPQLGPPPGCEEINLVTEDFNALVQEPCSVVSIEKDTEKEKVEEKIVDRLRETALSVPEDEPAHCIAANNGHTSPVQLQEVLPAEMDSLLKYCFLKTWKNSAKKIDLPVLTSSFFKVHMIPACPLGKSIDVKKSSYKKLSRFLGKMVECGIIKIAEQTKGVESIVGVDLNHIFLREFIDVEPQQPVQEGKNPTSTKPSIVEMYSVTAAVLPIFTKFGIRKGESLPVAAIRKHLTDYIRIESLQDLQDKRFVRLNPVLAQMMDCGPDVLAVSWEDLMSIFLCRMSQAYQITMSGDSSLRAKGKLEPIDIQVGKRSGNKKVTLINNLGLYGINLQEFARECQHGVAASTSISSVPGRKTAQLLVQGNQVLFVEKLLTGKYGIPKRYIRGLENAPKQKKYVCKV